MPSITETICDFGHQNLLAGVTNFCMYPKGLNKVCEIIGGTKDPSIDKIRELSPDIVFVNAEENKPEHIEKINAFSNVVVTDVKLVKDVPVLFEQIEQSLGSTAESTSYKNKLVSLLSNLNNQKTNMDRVVCFIWKDPWLAASRDTYISDVLGYYGLENVCEPDLEKGEAGRYPELSPDMIETLDPDSFLFSTEPWPFRKRDVAVFREITKSKKPCYKVDGKTLSWYGSSTVNAIEKALLFSEQGYSMFERIE